MKSRNYTLYFYLVTPVVLLACFILFFSRYRAEERAVADRNAQIAAEKAQEAAAAQADMERRLDAEARRIAEVKAQLEATKAAEIRAENERKINDLKTRMVSTNADLARLKARDTELDAQIKSVRAERIDTENRWLAQASAAEEVRAEKSVLELESQRLMGVVMDRFDGEWKAVLTAPPAPAAPAGR